MDVSVDDAPNKIMGRDKGPLCDFGPRLRLDEKRQRLVGRR